MESLIANMPAAASPLDGSRRLVVKIGSALLVDDDSGHIRRSWLDALMDDVAGLRSEEHTSELQSLMRISYAVFCLKTKITMNTCANSSRSHTRTQIITQLINNKRRTN